MAKEVSVVTWSDVEGRGCSGEVVRTRRYTLGWIHRFLQE